MHGGREKSGCNIAVIFAIISILSILNILSAMDGVWCGGCWKEGHPWARGPPALPWSGQLACLQLFGYRCATLEAASSSLV